jgi:ABC-type multidrug transport system permease subunit
MANMKSTQTPILITAIKIISTLLISGAIMLEAGNLIAHFLNQPLPDLYKWVMIIARFALVSHLIEAIIAGFSANSQGKNPLKSAVYTLFVGTVGLLEVLDRTNSSFFKQI